LPLFLGLLVDNVNGKPLGVILDNASVHKAKSIQPMLKLLEQRGLKLYFLPPYSPELNRIEKRWKKMKYTWMVFKARGAETLEVNLEKILDAFSTNFQMTFC
jgi:transposase